MSERTCGRCTACCTTAAIVSLAKPAGLACPKLRKGRPGCSIYETRPTECRPYKCEWLRGIFGEGDRPDLLRAVVDVHALSVGSVVIIHLLPGADQTMIMALVRPYLTDRVYAITMSDGSTTMLMVPDHFTEEDQARWTEAFNEIDTDL